MAKPRPDNENYIKVDHLGHEWPTMAAMLEHYGINYSAFLYRLHTMGLSLEEALTNPHKAHESTSIASTDHTGATFSSIKEMCDHWRIPRTTFFRRRRQGWSIERCLTTPVQQTGRRHIIYDHLGNTFGSIDEMCAAHDISKRQYMINIRNNCTLEEALTTVTDDTVIKNKSHAGRCKDHKGVEYESINALCRAYGITKDVMRSRIELGWTMEQILENPKKIEVGKKVKDHLQNEYSCQKEMLEAYGISENTFKHRIKNGHTLKEALLTKNLHVREHTDHCGNVFKDLQSMLTYWNCGTGTYHGMTKRGMPLEQILTTIRVKKKPFAKGLDLFITKQLTEDVFEVKFKGQTLVMKSSTIFNCYRQNCLENNGEDLILRKHNTDEKGTSQMPDITKETQKPSLILIGIDDDHVVVKWSNEKKRHRVKIYSYRNGERFFIIKGRKRHMRYFE